MVELFWDWVDRDMATFFLSAFAVAAALFLTLLAVTWFFATL
jgi:hypothetical protein